eukprot:4212131-Pleurochrysis_carterae.AAC.4
MLPFANVGASGRCGTAVLAASLVVGSAVGLVSAAFSTLPLSAARAASAAARAAAASIFCAASAAAAFAAAPRFLLGSVGVGKPVLSATAPITDFASSPTAAMRASVVRMFKSVRYASL